MNAFEQYLQKIDESSFDCTDVHTINSELLQIVKKFDEENKHELAKIADLDRQVFSVQKSFDYKLDAEKGSINGLSCQMSGTKTFEDGRTEPLFWPDVEKYTNEEFEYFEKRYKECKNLFAKTEYGLMVYFGAKTDYSRHNEFKRLLCTELFALSKTYYKKADEGGDKNYYSQYFFKTLRLAFGIAENSNLEPELTEIIQYVFKIHNSWDVTKFGTLRILLDLSGLLSDNFNIANGQIDFQRVLDKNLEGAKELEKTYVWGAMYAIDRNVTIEQKRKKPINELLLYKAKLYEKLAADADSKSNLACVGFAENALRLYKQLKLPDEIRKLEIYYAELRGKFKLSTIRQEIPKEYFEEMNERILTTIKNSSENEILYHFVTTPWYDSIDTIKKRSIDVSKETVLLSMLPASILDKFGNKVDVFYTEKEKEEFNFWNSYSLNYQVGTKTMHRFFIEAYKAGKLNYKTVIDFLEKTWFNDPIIRMYHGQSVPIKPIDTIKPGLKRIFEELDEFFKDNTYQFDGVTIIDSLTLKIEGLIRFFCEKIGIATFKPRQKGPDKLVMEKLLDDLLADIAHKPPERPDQETNFDEEDRMFIKYVLTEKAGLNLRHSVAHSLMDIYEYSFEQVVVIFSIILKLGKYKFIEN
jgi:hypothetical protein